MGRKKRKRAFDSEARVFNDFCLTDFMAWRVTFIAERAGTESKRFHLSEDIGEHDGLEHLNQRELSWKRPKQERERRSVSGFAFEEAILCSVVACAGSSGPRMNLLGVCMNSHLCKKRVPTFITN